MKKNILTIDDSALMRRVISDIISTDDRFEIVDSAVNGLEGLDLLIKNSGKYDIVLLDVNMPKMNGLDVLTQIQKYKMNCKVIMVSTLVTSNAKETILALERGAFDFVLKPNALDLDSRLEFRRKLLRSIEIAINSDEGSKSNDMVSKNQIGLHKVVNQSSSNTKKLVAIACSTGGPKSLKKVIPLLPKNLDAPVVLVQHMPAGFTKSLADRLNELSDIHVEEAISGAELKKGCVYIAPGGKHMRIVVNNLKKSVISISDEPPRDGLKPCANIMYESIIETNYDAITCVVLTGMGSDGTSGITKLSQKKNTYIISQDKDSCVVYGMPKSVYDAGLSNEVKPLEEIAEAIIKNVGVLNNGC